MFFVFCRQPNLYLHPIFIFIYILHSLVLVHLTRFGGRFGQYNTPPVLIHPHLFTGGTLLPSPTKHTPASFLIFRPHSHTLYRHSIITQLNTYLSILIYLRTHMFTYIYTWLYLCLYVYLLTYYFMTHHSQPCLVTISYLLIIKPLSHSALNPLRVTYPASTITPSSSSLKLFFFPHHSYRTNHHPAFTLPITLIHFSFFTLS